MFKLPTFLKNISPMDIPAFELVERVGNYGKPQEDFIFANIREFESSELFSYRDTSLQYFTNNTDIDNKERFYFDRRGNKILDTTVSNVKLKRSMYRKLVKQKVNYLLSKPFSIKGEPDTEEILTQYFNSDFLYQLQNVVRYSIMTGISWLQVYYDNDGNLKFKRIPENEVIVESVLITIYYLNIKRRKTTSKYVTVIDPIDCTYNVLYNIYDIPYIIDFFQLKVEHSELNKEEIFRVIPSKAFDH